MKRFTKSSVLLVFVVVVFVLPLVMIGGGAAENEGQVLVDDHELVFAECKTSGEVKSLRIVNWLALDGEGDITVRKTSDIEPVPEIQGMKGFSTPEVTDGEIVWKDVRVDGPRKFVTQAQITGDEAETSMEGVPLDFEYRYWLDGEEVRDLKDIAGKSGHFKMELNMENTSKKMTRVTYEDSITGEKKIEEVETYMPLIIQPYDWNFNNDVFYNLECDETGIIFYLPTAYNVGWSIPLFPPATEPEAKIWVEADVKNFEMEPLSLNVFFLFPKTNQKDPLPEFKAGLTEMYGGVQLLGSGLAEAVAGLGSAGTADTLLYGINQIAGGLSLLASPTEGLPYAEYNVSAKMIPGVQQAIAGLGSAESPDTLLYGANQISGGLQRIAAGIGSAETPDTLLYGASEVAGGLGYISGVIGGPGEKDTLLYGVNAIIEGGELLKAQIGSRTRSGTALYASNALELGLTTGFGGNPGIKTIAQSVAAGAAPGGTIDGYLGSLQTLVTNFMSNVGPPPYGNPREIATTIITGLQQNITSAANPLSIYNTQRGIIQWVDGAGGQPGLYAAAAGLSGGFDQILANLGSPDVKGNTLLYGAASVYGGLSAIKAGIGSATTPDSLLYGVNAISGGLSDIQAGIGSAETPDTLLYGSNAVYGGLSQMKAGLSTGSMANPGLLEGLQTLSSGLDEAVAGIAHGPGDTLLGGSRLMAGGLEQLKAGLEKAVNEGTNVMAEGLLENINNLDLTEGQLEAIARRGEEFDSFLGRVDDPEDAEKNLRFVFQNEPVQSSATARGWIIALVLTIVGAVALVLIGTFAFRKIS